MIIEIIVFIVTTLIAYFLYVHKKIKNHFDKNGVKYLPPVPVFGNVKKFVFGQRHLTEDLAAIYKAFPNERYVAYIEKTTPIILLRDLELVKHVTVKDFDHFVDHMEMFIEEVDPLFGGSVFQMKGEKWRDMRMTLSPAFTGSKMRHMVPLINDIAKKYVEYLREFPTDIVDTEDLMRRFTNDAIASVAFGLQINSLKDKNNDFFVTGKSIFNYTTIQKTYLLFVTLFPKLAKKLKIQLYPQSTVKFFKNILTSSVEYRKRNNLERPDVIQLLMESAKGTLKTDNETENDIGFATVQEELKQQESITKWSTEELVGQVFIFFIAGYDTVAMSLIYSLHELAINPEIEEKLHQEISEFKEKYGEVSYDNINELKYLDCVFNEMLRKWPQGYFLNRKCTKPYELPPPSEGGKPYTIKHNDIVYIPVAAIQNDPQYFPNPEKFDPDRFSDENKQNITPFTFIPFGSGPRNCVGSRLAILKTKLFLYHLVLNFKILKCAKTSDPIEPEPRSTNLRIRGGSFVKLEPRDF